MSLAPLQLLLMDSFRPSVTQRPPDFSVVFKRSWTVTTCGTQLMLQLVSVALSGGQVRAGRHDLCAAVSRVCAHGAQGRYSKWMKACKEREEGVRRTGRV